MDFRSSRRDFLKGTTLAGIGFWVGGGRVLAQTTSPNAKLGVAFIGCGGKGASDVDSVARNAACRVVALCDVDDGRAAGTFNKPAYQGVPKYKDFRKMLEERKDIDAVVVSTPDHIHAPATLMALHAGKHVYCQKPLTHTVYEARQVTLAAAAAKVATQMGNQGTANSGLREGAEIIQSGALGKVTQVHVWSNRPIWPQGLAARPGGEDPIPAGLDWDLWLGPAPLRPYLGKYQDGPSKGKDVYAPFAWRGWWDFGCGALGDMACHTTNLPFMGLKLYEAAPTEIEAEAPACCPEMAPSRSRIRFEFPARGDMPPVTLFWYDGGWKPSEEVLAPVIELYGGTDTKDQADRMKMVPGSGCLIVGDKGSMFSPDDYGARHRMLPEKEFEGFKPPEPTIRRSPGHYEEWILAATGNGPEPMSNFNYAGKLTEMMLLGNLSIRCGKKFKWDSTALKPIDCPEAEAFVSKVYRKGWEIG